MKYLKLFALIILLCCDPRPSPGVGGKAGPVKYWISNNHLYFENHCDESVYRSGDYYTVTVVWCCNTYKGKKGLYVSLTFDGNNNWKIESEYISSGICGGY